MPAEVNAQLAKLGCLDGLSTQEQQTIPPPSQAVKVDPPARGIVKAEPQPKPGVPKNILGTIPQLTGHVSLSNFKEFESFVSSNRDNIIGLKLSFDESKNDRTPIQASGEDEFTVYMKTDQASEMNFVGGYQHKNASYVADGFFRVKMDFFAQGVASYKLEPVDKNQTQFAKILPPRSLMN